MLGRNEPRCSSRQCIGATGSDEGELAELGGDVVVGRLDVVAGVRVDDHGDVGASGDLVGDIRGGRVVDEVDVGVVDTELVELLLRAEAVAAPVGAEHGDGVRGSCGHASRIFVHRRTGFAPALQPDVGRWMPSCQRVRRGTHVGIAVTVIVPTFNERDNVAELVARTASALGGREAEILFVDDSVDDTAAEIERVAASAPLPVRVIHRSANIGGLSGAVVVGLTAAHGDVCVVMDGDLKHPPELAPAMIDRFERGDAETYVVASRYVGGGDSGGLGTTMRFGVSRVSTWLTKAMFPRRLADATDPMTGFFLVDRRSLDLTALRQQDQPNQVTT